MRIKIDTYRVASKDYGKACETPKCPGAISREVIYFHGTKITEALLCVNCAAEIAAEAFESQIGGNDMAKRKPDSVWFGRITAKRVGFADIPVLEFVAWNTRDDCPTVEAKNYLWSALKDAAASGLIALPDGPGEIGVSFIPTVTRYSDGSGSLRSYRNGSVRTDANPRSATYGKRRRFFPFLFRFEIQRDSIPAFFPADPARPYSRSTGISIPPPQL